MTRVFAIRPIDARNWPCPWISFKSHRRGSFAMCSWPEPWPLDAAKQYVDDAGSDLAVNRDGMAVFRVSPRGRKQLQIHPRLEAVTP